MPRRLIVTVASSVLVLVGLPAQAQLPPPFESPSLPSPSGFSGSGGRSLRPGDFGGDVEALQLALLRNGLSPGPIDGEYGPLTQDAVREFQRTYDLPITGIAGPQTLDILGLNTGLTTNVARVNVPSVPNNGVAANNRRIDGNNLDLPYIAAITESTRKLPQVQRVFGNAAIDSARQGRFINIGRYSSRSAAADRVREARRLGFDARILYQR